MADERNFRSYYYEKFGFRGIEDKKSIEVLLKEKPLDIEKLRQFCLRFPVSAKYRLYLWKIILGVLPVNQDCHDFVMKQRTEQYLHLRHALTVMRRVDGNTSQPELFHKMFLIEEGLLPLSDNDMRRAPGTKYYIEIARAVTNMVEDSIDAYWVTTRFYRSFRRQHINPAAIQQLSEKMKTLLQREDTDQKLWIHLEKHDLWSDLPLTDWFSSCFAGILPDPSFERVGDIVLGGSSMILVYVAVAIFLTLRRPLLIMNSQQEMLKYLQQIPEDTGDILVSKAIDTWEKHGHNLTKSDSPGPVNRSPS